MNDPRLPRRIFGLLILAGSIYFSSLYSLLPKMIASHFNARGIPTAWMPKSAFFLIFPVVTLLVSVPVLLTPKLIAALPPDKINLPTKGYWLAPQRRADTVKYFEASLAWFGCALLSLLLFVFYVSLQANLNPARGFDSSSLLMALGAFLSFVLFWLIRMFSHFFRTPENHG